MGRKEKEAACGVAPVGVWDMLEFICDGWGVFLSPVCRPVNDMAVFKCDIFRQLHP